MKVLNEIIINEDNTLTVIGPLAHKLYYKHKKYLYTLNEIKSNSAWLFEVDCTLRAASHYKGVLSYYNENRIIVYKKAV